MPHRGRVRALVVAAGLLSLPLYGLDLRALAGATVHGLVWYVGLVAAAGLLYGLAAWAVLRRPAGDRVLLGLILGFGLLFRLAVLPTGITLSSDPYRYLWDGRVQWAGINPYRYPPDAPELAALRDDAIHPNINRPSRRTVYPPGAQALFAAVAAVAPDSIVGWRLFLLGCETLTVGLLLGLLRRLGRPALAVILYAWAPPVVYEGAQAGHLDLAVLPPILLALGWRQQGRLAAAGAALGVAVAIKLYPAALALAWWRRGDWRMPAAAAGVVALLYLPYALTVGPGVLGFLPEYFGSAEDFNIGLRHFLTAPLAPADPVGREVVRGVAMVVLFGALGAALLAIRRRLVESGEGVPAAGLAAAAAWLLLVPTPMHAWYVIWIVPFLALRPSGAWLVFSHTVALSYLTYVGGELPLWARALEYLPLYALLVLEHRAGRGAFAAPGRPAAAGPGPWRRPAPVA